MTFRCPLCSKNYEGEHLLQIHLRTHTGERPYKCEICGKCFNRNGTLKRHVMLHTGEKPHQCQFCKLRFRYRYELTRHVRKVHQSDTIDAEDQECNDQQNLHHQEEKDSSSSMTNTSNQNTNYFVIQQQPPQVLLLPQVCSNVPIVLINESQFSSSNQVQGPILLANLFYESCERSTNEETQDSILQSNDGIHLEKSQHSESTISNQNNINHRQDHSNSIEISSNAATSEKESNTSIVSCNVQYTEQETCIVQSDSLIVPEPSAGLDSNQEKKYKCIICSWEFKFKINLIRHMRSHTGEKPFKCEICGKGFPRKWNLKLHYEGKYCQKTINLQNHCGPSLQNQQNLNGSIPLYEKKHKCEICGKAFTRKDNLKHHLNFHAGISRFQCKSCGKKFLHKIGLKRHEVKNTKCCKANDSLQIHQELSQSFMQLDENDDNYLSAENSKLLQQFQDLTHLSSENVAKKNNQNSEAYVKPSLQGCEDLSNKHQDCKFCQEIFGSFPSEEFKYNGCFLP